MAVLAPALVPEEAVAELSGLDDVEEGLDGLPVSTDEDEERESVR